MFFVIFKQNPIDVLPLLLFSSFNHAKTVVYDGYISHCCKNDVYKVFFHLNKYGITFIIKEQSFLQHQSAFWCENFDLNDEKIINDLSIFKLLIFYQENRIYINLFSMGKFFSSFMTIHLCIDTCVNTRSKVIECHLHILTRSHSIAAFPQNKKNCQLVFTYIYTLYAWCCSYRGREKRKERVYAHIYKE
jgi:hypothetical protein